MLIEVSGLTTRYGSIATRRGAPLPAGAGEADDLTGPSAHGSPR